MVSRKKPHTATSEILDEYARAARKALDRAIEAAAQGQTFNTKNWLRAAVDNVHAIAMEVSVEEAKEESQRKD